MNKKIYITKAEPNPDWKPVLEPAYREVPKEYFFNPELFKSGNLVCIKKEGGDMEILKVI